MQDSPEVLARVREGLDLVELIANQMRRQVTKNVPRDDLVSFGREGLLSAARNFDSTRGVPFRAWANLRVRGAMMDGMRSMGGLPRRVYRQLRAVEAADHFQEAAIDESATAPAPTPSASNAPTAPLHVARAADERLSNYLAGMATAMAVGLLSTSASGQAEDVEDRSLPADERMANAQMATHLRKAVETLPEPERKLVEAHYFGGLTLDEAARQIGLSKSWGSRLHARAVESLAKYFKREKLSA